MKPLGYFVDFVVAGVPPDIMGIGPVPAIRKLLERNKLQVKDIDVFELNEAFAAQSLYCVRELGIRPTRSTPTAARSRWATRWACPAPAWWRTILRELKRRGGATASCRCASAAAWARRGSSRSASPSGIRSSASRAMNGVWFSS